MAERSERRVLWHHSRVPSQLPVSQMPDSQMPGLKVPVSQLPVSQMPILRCPILRCPILRCPTRALSHTLKAMERARLSGSARNIRLGV